MKSLRRHSRSSRTSGPFQATSRNPLPRGREAEEIVRAIGGGEVDAVVVLQDARECVVSLANFGAVSELNEVVRAIRAGEIDALVINQGGQDRIFSLAAMKQVLGESEDRFRLLAESMPGIVFTADAAGQFDYFNRAWWSYTGLDQAAPSDYDLCHAVEPARGAEIRSLWRTCVSKGECFEIELKLASRAGAESRWHLIRAVPLRDQSGAVLRWFGVCTDIDRVKRAAEELQRQQASLEHIVSARTHQLEESQNRLRLSERMAVLGTLAAGVGHDFSNLLVPMFAYLERLEESVPSSGQAAADFEGLRTCTLHLKRLVSGLRTFAVDPFQADHAESTDLAQWCEEALPLLSIAVPRTLSLRCQIAPGLPPAAIASIPLTQAVFNLVLNAAHALGDREDGLIRVSAAPGSDHQTILLSVTDNGPGMDEQTKRRCLEPFFTTKSGTCSTGLGLALVNQIVQQAKGKVEIASQLGQGTMFTLKLPPAPAPPSPPSR